MAKKAGKQKGLDLGDWFMLWMKIVLIGNYKFGFSCYKRNEKQTN